MKILRELLFNPGTRFTDLNVENLTSDHFSYYVKKLLEDGLVVKNDGGLYSLSHKGKEFANTMDDETSSIEKQPKVAVLVICTRDDPKTGKPQLLIQRRLKEPYYGYQGFFTGKVRFTEKIHEAAAREMDEETGMTGDLELKGIFQDIVYSTEGKLLENKLFHVFIATNCTGKLRKKFEGGENYWLDLDKFVELENKYYSEDDVFEFAFGDGGSGTRSEVSSKDVKKSGVRAIRFIERVYEIEEF